MTTTSDTEIKQLIGKLDQKLDQLDEKIDQKLNKVDEKLSLKIEKLDEKVDKITLAQGRNEEKLNGIDKRLERLEIRVDDQDKRFWTLITGAFLALFGLLAKTAFFPGRTPLS
ncbi:MAG: hypothetical protein AAFR77_07655 [Cyanobacteria bacterium J06631_2]